MTKQEQRYILFGLVILLIILIFAFLIGRKNQEPVFDTNSLVSNNSEFVNTETGNNTYIGIDHSTNSRSCDISVEFDIKDSDNEEFFCLIIVKNHSDQYFHGNLAIAVKDSNDIEIDTCDFFVDNLAPGEEISDSHLFSRIDTGNQLVYTIVDEEYSESPFPEFWEEDQKLSESVTTYFYENFGLEGMTTSWYPYIRQIQVMVRYNPTGKIIKETKAMITVSDDCNEDAASSIAVAAGNYSQSFLDSVVINNQSGTTLYELEPDPYLS